MTVVERIKESAKKRGYNLKTTALKAGLSENAIYSWQKYTPSSDKLAAVADVLHVSVDYLLGNTDDPNPAPKAGKPSVVDLADGNILMYQGDKAAVENIDADDWAIIKAVLNKARKNKGK
jgi:transcriptional regulator with XRE-family HTH domain